MDPAEVSVNPPGLRTFLLSAGTVRIATMLQVLYSLLRVRGLARFETDEGTLVG
jgi:hypothetical protein